MLYQMTVKFDPVLLKLFVGIIGTFPVGALVVLSNRALGIVTRTNPDRLDRPEVRLIADAAGEKSAPEWIDLSAAANRDITVVRIVDPEKYGIDVTDYILSD